MSRENFSGQWSENLITIDFKTKAFDLQQKTYASEIQMHRYLIGYVTLLAAGG